VTGHHYHDVIGTYTQQDVDLTKLFQDVAIYSERVMGPAHAENVAHVACRNALGRRGVAHINIPTDTQDQRADRRSMENVPHHQSAALHSQPLRPSESELQQAADVLNAGRRVVLLCGEEAAGAQADLVGPADTLAAPIITQGLCPAVPDDSPYSIGCLGLLGAPAAQQALAQADTIFLIGATFPYSEALPLAQGVRVVQLAQSPVQLGRRYALTAGLVGELAATLQALLPRLRRQEDRDFLNTAQQGRRDWQGGADSPSATANGAELSSHGLWRELGQRLTPQSLVVSDPGTVAPQASPGTRRVETTAIPNGLPYAIAAQLARPDYQCVAVVTAASFSLLMAEFATAVKYRLPIRVVLASPPDGEPQLDFAAFARACGGAGFTIRSARECGDILDHALAEPGPALIAAQLPAQA